MRASIHTYLRAAAAVLALAAAVSPAGAQWQTESKDGAASIRLGFLIQPQLELLETVDQQATSTNLFIRRLRLLVGGALGEHWSFFFETDSPNLGQEPASSARKPFPLVVFSPGWGGPIWIHISVATRLASHGFVVAVMYHFGDQWWWWEPPFDAIAVASYNRPRDVAFVLTNLLERNNTQGNLLFKLIRPDQGCRLRLVPRWLRSDDACRGRRQCV